MPTLSTLPPEIKLMILTHYMEQYIDDTIYTTARLPLGCSGQERSFYADKSYRNNIANDKILDLMLPFPDMQPLILDMLEAKRAGKERECLEQGIGKWMLDKNLDVRGRPFAVRERWLSALLFDVHMSSVLDGVVYE